MRRRIGMRRAVHEGRDLLREDARLGVVMEALDLDVGEVGPQWRVVPPRVGEVVEEQAGLGVLRGSTGGAGRGCDGGHVDLSSWSHDTDGRTAMRDAKHVMRFLSSPNPRNARPI